MAMTQCNWHFFRLQRVECQHFRVWCNNIALKQRSLNSYQQSWLLAVTIIHMAIFHINNIYLYRCLIVHTNLNIWFISLQACQLLRSDTLISTVQMRKLAQIFNHLLKLPDVMEQGNVLSSWFLIFTANNLLLKERLSIGTDSPSAHMWPDSINTYKDKCLDWNSWVPSKMWVWTKVHSLPYLPISATCPLT